LSIISIELAAELDMTVLRGVVYRIKRRGITFELIRKNGSRDRQIDNVCDCGK